MENACLLISSISQSGDDNDRENEVTTEDGYILTVFRIRHGANSTETGCYRPPILLDHSLLCDGSEFVMNPPHSSPGMVLADSGFDVFLMNHRGTTYSRKHRDFDTSDPRYWKFTMDEHAKYDIPVVIDYVLNVTGEKSLYWSGHSQGSQVGFMLLSERPEYNQRIRALFQLAAPGTAHYAKGVWRLLYLVDELFKPLIDFYRSWFGSHEIGLGPNRRFPQQIMQLFCATPYLNEICKNVMYFIVGEPTSTFNFTRWPSYITFIPASTSTWNMLHWGQMAVRNKLEHFDHNPIENMKKYGQTTAPPYNLTKVDVPVYIFWSSSDWLISGRDIEENLLPSLKNGIVKGIYEVPDYNHLDFVTATDNAENVFHRIISVVRKQEEEMCGQSKLADPNTYECHHSTFK
ncbi:hypothetical protein PRIPAC_78045 [Pristionchus pacificus]|uniref:Lipase n=1 Tax=Pristionchus pacificus TaxID=54126 RepID=A0A8R1U751_PRIPA|nr:hypothetical protein PRIPAC_78045 [Pristionchus pacificus]|eukprot:PDM73076.1 hydrolase [Pristionchus pacificus]